MIEINSELIPVISWFIKDLASKYGNAGCNDIPKELEILLTDEVKDILKPHLNDPCEHSFNFDFIVAHAVIKYLKEVQS